MGGRAGKRPVLTAARASRRRYLCWHLSAVLSAVVEAPIDTTILAFCNAWHNAIWLHWPVSGQMPGSAADAVCRVAAGKVRLKMALLI